MAKETVDQREKREAGIDRLRISKLAGGGEFVYQGDKEEAPQKRAEEAYRARCEKCSRQIGFTAFVRVTSTTTKKDNFYHRACAKEF